MPITQVEDLADTRIAQKISQLAGVGLVSINGAQRPAVRIQVNLQALAAYGLNIDDVRTTISNANSDAPKGSFDGAARAYSIDANDQIANAAAVPGHHRRLQRRPARRCVCPTSPRSRRAPRTTSSSSWMNTTPAILLNVQRQPGANVIAVVDQIRKLLPEHPQLAAGQRRRHGAHRPHQHHPRLGQRRAVRTVAGGGAGGAGDLPVPAQRAGDHHPEPVGAAVADRHLRGDVSARLQPQQPVADGADHRLRLRGGRCHRDDREHLALYRKGREAAGGGAQGLRARSASPSCR